MTLDFVIPPSCGQTGWFFVACAAGAGALIWCVAWFRVRQLATRMRRLHEQRMAERDRIAHERHDTLVQSTQGLILRFQAATDRMASDDPARAALAQVLDRAEEVLKQQLDRLFDPREPPRSHDRVNGG